MLTAHRLSSRWSWLRWPGQFVMHGSPPTMAAHLIHRCAPLSQRDDGGDERFEVTASAGDILVAHKLQDEAIQPADNEARESIERNGAGISPAARRSRARRPQRPRSSRDTARAPARRPPGCARVERQFVLHHLKLRRRLDVTPEGAQAVRDGLAQG